MPANLAALFTGHTHKKKGRRSNFFREKEDSKGIVFWAVFTEGMEGELMKKIY